jgi:hypothetical protein
MKPLVEIRCLESGKLLGVLGRDDGRLVIEGEYRDPDLAMHLDSEGKLASDRSHWNQRYVLRGDPREVSEGTEVVPLMACVNKAKHCDDLDTVLLARHLTQADRSGRVRILLLDPQ